MRPNLGAVIGGMRDADETRSEAFLGDFLCLLTLTITLVSGSGLGSFLIIDLVTRRVKCETTSCDIVNVEQNKQWKFYRKAFHICYSSCENLGHDLVLTFSMTPSLAGRIDLLSGTVP